MIIKVFRFNNSFILVKVYKKPYSTSRVLSSHPSDTDMSDTSESDNSDSEMSDTSSNGSGDASRVNPQDGSDLDRTIDLVKYCKNSREVENYFTTKENSVRSAYTCEHRSFIFASLPSQKSEVYDMGVYTDPESSITDRENENVGNNNTVNPNTSKPEGNSSSNNFAQDSSDVTQTDFDPSDHYDDF